MDCPITINKQAVARFCKRWKIVEMSLFGSVLRDDFNPDSDIDVLVTFSPEAQWSLWDFPQMQDELKAIFGREVDIVEKDALKNPFRRHSILTTKQVVYAD
jgi:hypothetical protein